MIRQLAGRGTDILAHIAYRQVRINMSGRIGEKFFKFKID